jgi:cytochrome b6-f complex iron-sulfur subunit
MTRKEFISKLGVGAAFALTTPCISSCSKDEAPEPRDIDFDVDLTLEENAPLATNGGFVIIDGVVVARSLSGEYVAATVTCSHNAFDQVIYQDGEWFCTRHGARFDETGQGLNPFGSDGLTVFNTQLIDNETLRVFS